MTFISSLLLRLPNKMTPSTLSGAPRILSGAEGAVEGAAFC
jgi:hypothetical protein